MVKSNHTLAEGVQHIILDSYFVYFPSAHLYEKQSKVPFGDQLHNLDNYCQIF